MTAPTQQPLPITLVLLAAASIALNIGMHRFTYGVMLPALRRDLDLDYLASGSLNAVHLAAYLAGTLLAPRLVRKMGSVRLAKVAHGLIALGALVCAAAPTAPALGIAVLSAGRIATGLGAGAAVLSVLVIALGAVSAARRPMVSAVVWSGMGAAIIGSGLAISPLLGPSIGWRAAFVATAALALALAICFPPKNAPRPEVVASSLSAKPFRPEIMLTARWAFLLIAYLMFGVGYIAYATFAGARMAAADAPLFATGAMWAAFGAASIIGAGITIAILGAPRLTTSSLAFGLGLAAFGAAMSGIDDSAAAVAGALLVGLSAASTPSIVSAEARERSSAEDYASAFSYATAALGIGQLAGPVLAGALADAFGTVAAPLFAAAAYVCGALAATLDIKLARRA